MTYHTVLELRPSFELSMSRWPTAIQSDNFDRHTGRCCAIWRARHPVLGPVFHSQWDHVNVACLGGIKSRAGGV